MHYATDKLSQVPGLKIIGQAQDKGALISFVIDGVHPADIGAFFDYRGIAIRTGHHCAQPVMRFFKIPAAARASFAFYNTKEEVDFLAHSSF